MNNPLSFWRGLAQVKLLFLEVSKFQARTGTEPEKIAPVLCFEQHISSFSPLITKRTILSCSPSLQDSAARFPDCPSLSSVRTRGYGKRHQDAKRQRQPGLRTRERDQMCVIIVCKPVAAPTEKAAWTANTILGLRGAKRASTKTSTLASRPSITSRQCFAVKPASVNQATSQNSKGGSEAIAGSGEVESGGTKKRMAPIQASATAWTRT
jgi:hypothetical protein